MRDGDLLILKGSEVDSLLAGREREIIESVRHAYIAHAEGQSSLPHSLFLRFPDQPRDRIIALPAYLGAPFGVAGIKWISSFPGNLERGLERASAAVLLNSTETGRPEALIEGSLISAKRTAASAALAAQQLRADGSGGVDDSASLVGLGVINFEIARFLLATCPDIKRLFVYDLDAQRAEQFKQRCLATFEGLRVEVVTDMTSALSSSPLVSLATTALKPHIADLSMCAPATTILHVSLRDLTPEVILSGDNVVDDVDHVARAETSVHLAEQLTGNRDFIRCTLADILRGVAPARRDDDSISIFSPFGLGVLDLALSEFVRRQGLEQGLGTMIPAFLPRS